MHAKPLVLEHFVRAHELRERCCPLRLQATRDLHFLCADDHALEGLEKLTFQRVWHSSVRGNQLQLCGDGERRFLFASGKCTQSVRLQRALRLDKKLPKCRRVKETPLH